ncbi:MAG: nucleotidyltransferase family protein [Luteitalea sp.]
MTPALLVLAAGMGSRYGGLKQLDSMGPHGETVMDYAIFDALRAGFGRVVFVIRRDFEAPFRQLVLSRYEGRVPVSYCFQDMEVLPGGFTVPPGRTKPWGTSHAILAAREVLQEPFAAINADDFYGQDSYRVLHAFLADPARQQAPDIYAMVGFTLRHTLSAHGTVARGVCMTDGQGHLRSVRELTKLAPVGDRVVNQDGTEPPEQLTGDEPVSLNMWGFTPTIFAQIETVFTEFLAREGQTLTSECYIPSVVDALVSRGLCKVEVLPTTSRWFGVTYREDKPAVVQSMAELASTGAYPAPLFG